MHIHLSGHHLDITDGIRNAVNSKFSKIGNHYPDINTLSVAPPWSVKRKRWI